jgi:hypothetical protein
MVSQQDGAIPHISHDSLQWPRQQFGDPSISRRCETEWDAHSLDRSSPSYLFFLGGFLKDNVCEKHLLSILQLKSEVTANVKLEEYVHVMFRCTCNAMGVHLEHTLERACNSVDKSCTVKLTSNTHGVVT